MQARLREFHGGDARWVVDRHAAIYAAEELYDARFGAMVAGIVDGFLAGHDPARERGWIAEAAGHRLGCIFCVAETDRVARLRLFLVEPEARGSGIGTGLLAECLRFARGAGYGQMLLWTHASHVAACAMYAAHGFRMIEAGPAEAFGQPVVDQTWQLDL